MIDVGEVVVHRASVFYGSSGSGKTTIGASFPKPLLLLEANDQGTDSIADVDGIKVYPITSLDDLETAYWYLVQHKDEYKTVMIDTVSQVQHIALCEVLAEKNKDSDRAGEWGVMTKQEWGSVASLMKMWITRFRDLPLETVFIAQDRVFNVDEEDAETILAPEVGPQLMPSVTKHLNAMVQVIGHTFIRSKWITKKLKGGKTREIERTQFCLRLAPDPVYITKVRKPKGITVPKVLVDPDYEDIVSIIKGEF